MLPSPFARFLAVISHLLGIAVVFVHALGHHSDTQPETQDKIFQCRDAVDVMLRPDELGQNRLPGFVELICELVFV